MHELSVAQRLLEIACEHLAPEDSGRVERVRVAIGTLTCIHEASLRFAFEAVIVGTQLAGAQLEIRTIPVEIFCVPCNACYPLPGIQSFRCPVCDAPSSDLRHGNELDLESLVLQPCNPESSSPSR